MINERQEKVNFTILNRDTSKGEIQLRLQFFNPKNISIDTEMDKIKVTFIEDVEAKSRNSIVYVPETTEE